MAIEQPEFKEFKKEIWQKTGEFDAAWEFLKENLNDPHLNFDLEALTNKDLEMVKKFQDEALTEQEISDYLNNLDKKGLQLGNPRYDFAAALKNKVVVKEGWRRRQERQKAA